MTTEVKKTIINEIPEVQGVYDLFLHDYGPDRKLASCHVEVPDVMRADEIDEMTRRIQLLVYEKHQIIMEAVGIYSINTSGDEAALIQEEIMRLLLEEPYVIQMHGFYLNKKERRIHFDIIIDFAAPDRKAEFERVTNKVRERYPDYTFTIANDIDITD